MTGQNTIERAPDLTAIKGKQQQTLPVPAKGKAELVYRVRVKF